MQHEKRKKIKEMDPAAYRTALYWRWLDRICDDLNIVRPGKEWRRYEDASNWCASRGIKTAAAYRALGRVDCRRTCLCSQRRHTRSGLLESGRGSYRTVKTQETSSGQECHGRLRDATLLQSRIRAVLSFVSSVLEDTSPCSGIIP